MLKTCAYVECDKSFKSGVGKGHNRRYCSKTCKSKQKSLNDAEYGKRFRATMHTPKKVVGAIKRTVVKLTTPKPKVCGGCGETYLMKEAHEIYCVPCNHKLDKMKTVKYQKDADDSHLHPQDSI